MAAKKSTGVKLTHPDGERTYTADSPAELHNLLASGYRIAEKGLSVNDAAARLAGNVDSEPAATTGSQQTSGISTSTGKGDA